jgi:hypothetical protein
MYTSANINTVHPNSKVFLTALKQHIEQEQDKGKTA